MTPAIPPIGTLGTITLSHGSLTLRVKVVKTRLNWGRLQLQVKPVDSVENGALWIAAYRLKVEPNN
jgi:hypothetical protein